MQLLGTVLFGSEVTFLPSRFVFVQLTLSIFLEWALSTQFSATDEFLKKWADAQKYAYSKGAGWLVSPLLLPKKRNTTSLTSLNIIVLEL